jgi:hypothetical protein
LHPSSRIARENVEVFCDAWAQSVNELSRLAKESDAAASGRVAAEKQAYMSLPRPGVSSVSSSSLSLPAAADDRCSSSGASYHTPNHMVEDHRCMSDDRENFDFRMSLILDQLNADQQPTSE